MTDQSESSSDVWRDVWDGGGPTPGDPERSWRRLRTGPADLLAGRAGQGQGLPEITGLDTADNLSDNSGMRQDTRVTVRLDAATVEGLDAIAEREGVKRSEVIRDALTASLAASTAIGATGPAPAVRTLVRALLAIEGDAGQLALFEKALHDAEPQDGTSSRGRGPRTSGRPGRGGRRDLGDVRPGTGPAHG